MSTRYISALEYRAAPTAVDTTSLVYGGNSAANDAELVRVLNRVGGMIDSWTSNPLVASSRTFMSRIRINNGGDFVFHPGDWPIMSVTSLSLGYAANQLTAVSAGVLAAGWYDTVLKAFIIPSSAGWMGTGVPVQFGGWAPRSNPLVSATYVAGYPSTWLTATANASATAIVVGSYAGIQAGQTLTIVDGANTETVTVTTTPTSTTVAVSALAYTHTFTAGDANQIAVHAMPDEVREAAILLTSAVIRTRGNDSLTLSAGLAPTPGVSSDPTAAQNIRLAKDILSNFRRVR